MRKLTMTPDGWPCTYAECPPGFFVHEDNLCLKSEYGQCEGFNCGGEYFWGGAKTEEARATLMVQPVISLWIEEEV